MRLLRLIPPQTCVALKLSRNRRFVYADLIRNRALRQTRFLQCINLVTLSLSEAVLGSHSCSFTLGGEKHLGIAGSRFILRVKLHWRVESANVYLGGFRYISNGLLQLKPEFDRP